ncbi:class I SAM-dependent rRNA methyltransferase [Hoeflea marina]|uniref:class I SAM-dependent rRNA methyltransferase n=1 Tax=Hoeflea marina TaxID=274592 RepID=UPI000D70BA9E|nr:class I SAM-dependent rRNA methyltransferase [Hoeflea marina]
MTDKRKQQPGRRGGKPGAATPAGTGTRAAAAKPGRPASAKPHRSPSQAPRAEHRQGVNSAKSRSAPAEAAVPVETSGPARILNTHAGSLPDGRAPVILETASTPGYSLIDSGHGEKLEQYGPYRIVRPEAQALWPRRLPASAWSNADAIFTGDTEEDGIGRWAFPKTPLGETWPMNLLDVDFWGRLTSFRHVGVFPEQIAHWQWMADRIAASRRPMKVLNLFGYTGVASLVAARAGAEVTHVDASKKAIVWARENQALAGLESSPIRWICDDAMKFIQREERRGNRYDIILTDPPKFGRGPNGEVWQLFEHLPLMLDILRELLTPQPTGLVLTAYSIRASFYSIHELMRETMRGAGGLVESGELIIRESRDGDPADCRALSTSLFSRWIPT